MRRFTPSYVTSQYASPLIPSKGTTLDGQLQHQDFPQSTRTTIHLDSRDRDYAVHASSSNFTVKLPEAIKNVAAAVLLTAEIPLSYYVFSASRNNTTLRVSVAGVSKDVVVPDGNYDTTSMAAALKAGLEAQYGGRTFTVAFSTITMRCTISTAGNVPVTVDTTSATQPTEWGLGYYLGFARGVVSTSTYSGDTTTVTGAAVANLNPENYVLLDIAELNGLSQSVLYGVGGSSKKTFAKIPLYGSTYTYNFYDKSMASVEQRPQHTKLDKLAVSIRFHDGTLVDLNGAEWSFSIEVACTLTRGL
jgi:hypothetical protein